MSDKYVLDADNNPVKVATIEEWARFFENDSNRRVGFTQITSQVEVSTVFLGIDHRFGGDGPPILFETIVFGGDDDENTWRYCTWDEAKAGHDRVVARLREAQRQLAAR